jgi:flagellar assembly factor FliW
MKVMVPNMGEVEVAEDKIINFVQGPLAFEDYKKFFIIDPEENDFPFKLLQSAEEESLGFILTDPFTFKPDYDIELNEDVLQELEIEKPEDILVFVFLVIPDKVEDISANLVAPIIINAEKRLAKQVILDGTDYETKYRIFQNVNS